MLSNGSSAGVLSTNSNHPLVFQTNATERLRIDSSGRVGIGTISPGEKLDISSGTSGTAAVVKIQDPAGRVVQIASPSSSTEAYIGTTTNHRLDFYTNNTVKATLDASGRLLVGTSSASATVNSVRQFCVEAADNYVTQVLATNQNNANGSYLALQKSRGTTANSTTVVVSGDEVGTIQFIGTDGTSRITAAQINAYVDGTPGTNDMPGRLVFSTTADGASSPTERMRIHANGYITYGTGSVDSIGLTFGPTRSGADSAPTLTWNGSFAGTVTACDFLYNGARQGSITTTTSATAYNTSSDYRLKENIVPLTGAVDRVNQLQVHRFNFIANPDKTVDGFIAHEAQAVVPECVTGTKDAVDDDGNPVYQGIDQSKLVPLLTAALQEAIAKIETLEAAVAALQSA
jgi:hypothetical protein